MPPKYFLDLIRLLVLPYYWFQPLIVIYRIGYFVFHHLGCILNLSAIVLSLWISGIIAYPELVILCFIIGNVHQFICHCLIPLDPWLNYTADGYKTFLFFFCLTVHSINQSSQLNSGKKEQSLNLTTQGSKGIRQ